MDCWSAALSRVLVEKLLLLVILFGECNRTAYRFCFFFGAAGDRDLSLLVVFFFWVGWVVG